MSVYGSVIDVSTNNLGEPLVADALVGDTWLFVGDVSTYSDAGGSVLINDVEYDYDELDEDSNALILSNPLASAAFAGDIAYIYPLAPEKVALVSLDDDVEAVSVVVPHNLQAVVADGFREEADREVIELEERAPGEFYIRDMPASKATITTEALTEVLSDGEAPTSSPTPTATGGVGFITVRWTPITNADYVTYQLHVSTDPNFVAGQTNIIGVTPSNSITVRMLPDMTLLKYGVAYYFRVIATDDDGAAPASGTASASLQQVTGADIAVNYVYAGNVLADQITGGTIQSDLLLSGNIKTATAGARVELGPFGLAVYNSAGNATTLLGSNGVNTFYGSVQAVDLTVLNGMSIRGMNNELSRTAVLTLATATTAPSNSPTVIPDFEDYTLKNSDGTVLTVNPLSLDKTSDGLWIAACSDLRTRRWNADGSYHSSIGLEGGTKDNSNYTQVNAFQPGYYFNDAGYLKRDYDQNSLTGPRYQLKDSLAGSLAANFTAAGNTTSDSGAAYFAPDQNAANPASLTSINSFDFRGHGVLVDLSPDQLQMTPVFQRFEVKIQIDALNYARLYVEYDNDPQISAQVVNNGVTVDSTYSLVYDPVLMKRLRIVEVGGNISFQARDVNDANGQVLVTIANHGWTKAQLSACKVVVGGYDTTDGGNINPNSAFTTNTSGWTAYRNSSISRVISPAHNGFSSMQIKATSSGNAGAATLRGSNAFQVYPGQVITVTAWGRSASAFREMYIYGHSFDDIGSNYELDQTSYQSTGAVIDSPNTWASRTVTFTVPTSATSGKGVDKYYFAAEVGFLGCSANEVHYIDDVTVSVSPVTAHASNVKWEWSSERALFPRANTTQTPALGNNGSNLLVAEMNASKQVVIKEVDPGDMITVLNTYTSSAVPSLVGPLKAVMYGNFDFGSARFIVKDSGNGDFYSFSVSGTALTAQLNENFPADSGGSAGAAWDGTIFQSLGTNGHMYKRTSITWNDAGSYKTLGVAYTWFDGDTTGGTHETAPSPVKAFIMSKRARYTVTSTTIPDQGGTDDPDRIRVYLASSPTGTLYLQATTAEGAPTARLTAATFSGTVAPTSSNFPGATPAVIKNSDSSLIISGNADIKTKTLVVTDSFTPPVDGFASRNLTASAGQSVPTTTDVKVALDNARAATVGNITWSATNNQFTVGTSGRYNINCCITLKPATAGTANRLETKVQVNGADYVGFLQPFNGVTGAQYVSCSLGTTVRLTAGDTVALVARQATGSTQTIHPGVFTFMDIQYVGS